MVLTTETGDDDEEVAEDLSRKLRRLPCVRERVFKPVFQG
jgi:hypothetical protein